MYSTQLYIILVGSGGLVDHPASLPCLHAQARRLSQYCVEGYPSPFVREGGTITGREMQIFVHLLIGMPGMPGMVVSNVEIGCHAVRQCGSKTEWRAR